MPLLKKKPFKRNKIPEGLGDDDEVYYCDVTKEVFTTHDEFFERVMLTNSVIWQCELTGRPDLTFQEAIESENTARKMLRQFPSALRGPVLFVASLTKRSALKELVDDVFLYVKDRFFKDEKIDVVSGNGRNCRFAKITELILPEDYDKTKSYEEPLSLEYRVEAIDDKKEPQSWVVKGESIRRDKTIVTREKTKLFIKQHVECANLLLKVKEASLKKYVTERGLNTNELVVGALPTFETSKKLLLHQEKQEKSIKQKASKKSQQNGKADKEKPEKAGKKKTKKMKNGDITKFLNSSDSALTKKELSLEEKKKREENSKKLREEMEARKKKKADLEAEKKRKAEEDKQRIITKTHAAVKELNQLRDDLELIDQRVMPKGRPVSTLIDSRHFGDIIRILEFFHSFPETVSSKEKFPFGFTMDILERALLLKEINGPLSDIFQSLLSAIFNLQIEENGETEIEYRVNSGDIPVKHPQAENMKKAAAVHLWVEKNMRTRVHDMAIDSSSLSEILRLHLLGSGAIVSDKTSKYRIANRGGYKSQDDPGLYFVQSHPKLMRSLGQVTIFELSTEDIIGIIHCLIDQILSFTNIRDIIDERLEQSINARLEYKNLKQAEGRRERKVAEEKKALHEEHKVAIAGFAEEQPAVIEALIKNAEAELEKKIGKIDAVSAKEHAIHLRDLQAQVSVFFNHQTYLGSDRAFRNYFIYESLPGVFVEHDISTAGRCMEKFTKNNAALAHCTKEQRYQIIKQMITSEESTGANDDKENKVGVNGAEKASTVVNGKKEVDCDLQKDLYMCNCDPSTCIVHSESIERQTWTFFHTAEEIDALIESLNPKGYREKNLLEQLESSRDHIVDYIKRCPVEKITVALSESEKAEEVKRISKNSNKKYDNPYFGYDRNEKPTHILESLLRMNMLDLEEKVTMGCLGRLKVLDRDLWRKYMYENEYHALDDELTWGNARKQTNGVSNGHAENGKAEAAEDEEEEETESSETASTVDGLEHLNMLLDDDDTETPSSDEIKLSIPERESIKLKTKNLASALLQIEQSIDMRYIREPFRPTKEPKDKALLAKIMVKCKEKILKWEESLMKSTNYSQICLHFNILYDSILWKRSAQKSGCMICRKKVDPEQTLLCDECNRGWHMYCIKPKMTEIPKGDWFCIKCRPDDYKRSTRKRRQVFVEEEEEDDEEEEEEEDEEMTADETMDSSQIEDEICHFCQEPGTLISCTSCEYECHMECAQPQVKSQRKAKTWKCQKCIKVEERSARVKRRRIDRDDDDVDEEEEESEDERPVKSARVSDKRRSKKNFHSDDDEEEEEVMPAKRSKKDRRSSRSARNSRRNTPDDSDEYTKPSRRESKKSLESAAERRASRRSFDPFNTISLSNLIDEVIKNKNSWPFVKPVSQSEVPDYYEVIKRPMDIGKIKSKMNFGDYQTNEQIMRDFEQIFINCDMYNNNSSEIYQAGVKLEKFVIKRSKELHLPYKPSDMSS